MFTIILKEIENALFIYPHAVLLNTKEDILATKYDSHNIFSTMEVNANHQMFGRYYLNVFLNLLLTHTGLEQFEA